MVPALASLESSVSGVDCHPDHCTENHVEVSLDVLADYATDIPGEMVKPPLGRSD